MYNHYPYLEKLLANKESRWSGDDVFEHLFTTYIRCFHDRPQMAEFLDEFLELLTKDKETSKSKLPNIDTPYSEIIFRARSKETGEWVEGNYHHNIRKGIFHAISPKSTNETIIVYRESLQLKRYDGEWMEI